MPLEMKLIFGFLKSYDISLIIYDTSAYISLLYLLLIDHI